METQVTVHEFDRDGAIAEAAARLDREHDPERASHSRRAFLRRMGMGASVVAGGGVVAGLLPALARGAVLPQSDVDILNYALTLEYLESAFYTEAKKSGALKDEPLRFARVVSNHEFSHVKALQQLLGAGAIAQPAFDFKGTTHDLQKFMATADHLENLGVHAYLGQAGNIKTPSVLMSAARILPVEARHAAWIRDIRFSGGTTVGTTPAPAAFEDGFPKDQVLKQVTATGFLAQ